MLITNIKGGERKYPSNLSENIIYINELNIIKVNRASFSLFVFDHSEIFGK